MQDDDRRAFLLRSMLSCGLLSAGSAAGWAQGLPATPAMLDAKPMPRPRAWVPRPLQAADANGIRLPAGFTSRVIARSGRAVEGTKHVWHAAPDGGATFARPRGGWVYVSNAELDRGAGGVSAVAFDAAGRIAAAYPICSGTSRNCAGGPTPWGTWLTCEEVEQGRVIECDPQGGKAQQARDALGWFAHEAAAVDPSTGDVYLTEDRRDGGLYRFRPRTRGDLSQGTLEIAQLIGAGPWSVAWLTVPEPNPSDLQRPTRHQVRAATAFDGGEGAWYHQGIVYIATKGDNRIWALDIAAERISVIYDATSTSTPVLTGVDNVTVSAAGAVLVAEDEGHMQVCVVGPAGRAAPLLQVEGHPKSEVAGIAFSPDGRRLYFSSQRGASGRNAGGITYEVTGPFDGV